MFRSPRFSAPNFVESARVVITFVWISQRPGHIGRLNLLDFGRLRFEPGRVSFMAELFDRFGVDRVPRWPLLSRLLALSVVLHGLLIVTLAYVPTLRSILHVAGAASGLKFVSEDYDPTLIGQRATIVRLPHEKLYYPPDYFGAPEVAETSPFDTALVQQAAPPPPPPPVFYRPPRRAYT